MKLLLLDVETSPNLAHIWGLFNQNISTDMLISSGVMLCWSAKWLGEKTIHYASHREANYLGKLHALLEEADAVITYNGDKFDLPVINKEFISAGMTPPAPYKSIVVYKTVRRVFKFASNKLNYVCEFLQLGSKQKHTGFKLWSDCMAGDNTAWKLMEKYNKQDVVILEKLYKKMLPWIKNHPNDATHDNHTNCPRCASSNVVKRGYYYTQSYFYQRFRCSDCGAWSRAKKGFTVKEGLVNAQ